MNNTVKYLTRLVWPLLALACVCGARAEEEASGVELRAVAEPGFVRLKWLADPWPAERTGFVVKRRRPQDSLDQKWSTVSAGVVSPNALPDHDLRAIEPDDRNRQVLELRRTAMMDAKVMSAQGSVALCLRLATEPEFCTYVRDQVGERMDFALAFGFGMVDHSLITTGHYEYALFAVEVDGTTSKVAAARTEVDVASMAALRLALHGEAAEGQGRLLWIPLVWEPNWKGFQVWKRTPPDRAQLPPPWEPASGLIQPGVWVDRKLEDLGLESDQLKHLLARERSIVEGLAAPLSPPEMRKRLAASTLEDLRVLGSMFRHDYDFALLNGFGFVDRHFDGPTEYAIYPVNGAGVILTNEGVSRVVEAFQPDDPELAILPIVTEKERSIRLSWTVSWALMDKQQLFGFEVYRRLKGGSANDGRKVTDHILSSSSAEAGLRTWFYVDDNVNVGESYEYAVMPISVFQTPRHSLQWQASGPVPMALKPLDVAVEIDAVVTNDAGGRTIAWHTSGANADKVSGFEVEVTDMTRTNRAGATYTVKAPSDARSVSVDAPSAHGHVYRYEVAALDGAGFRHSSESRTEYFVATYVPEMPKGIAAECRVRDGIPYIRLRWNDGALTNPQVRGYAFWSDRTVPGTPQRMTSLPVSQTNEIELAMREATGRELLLGVAAISTYGDQGEIGWTTCYVPVGEMPPPDRLAGEVAGDGRSPRLTWQYPALHELRGFRIYCNGAMVADEHQASAATRQWIGGEMPANRLQRFHVVAVDQDGHLSRESVQVKLFRLQGSNVTTAVTQAGTGEGP